MMINNQCSEANSARGAGSSTGWMGAAGVMTVLNSRIASREERRKGGFVCTGSTGRMEGSRRGEEIDEQSSRLRRASKLWKLEGGRVGGCEDGEDGANWGDG